MIEEKPTLRWHRSCKITSTDGEVSVAYQCREHPELYRLTKKKKNSARWVDGYFLEGIEGSWETPGEALAAIRESLPPTPATP